MKKSLGEEKLPAREKLWVNAEVVGRDEAAFFKQWQGKKKDEGSEGRKKSGFGGAAIAQTSSFCPAIPWKASA